MSTVLRAYGADFDVDTFLAGCTLSVCAVMRRGEPVFPTSQSVLRRHERSGIHVIASCAEFSDFSRQVDEAMQFLRVEADPLRRLCTFPGVEDITLDFGAEWRDVVVQCDHLPPELVRQAGLLGLGIELSHYPISGEEPDG